MNKPRGVVLFLLLLLATRALLVLAALDPAEERVIEVIDPALLSPIWSQGPERPLYDREELYTGTAAQAMRLGLDLPYRFMPYGSGSLIFSVLAWPVQAVFGTGYLALKLLPLLVTLVGGLCWLLVTRQWLGGRAALAFAALYLFAPSNFVRTTLIAKGDHAEAMAWIGVVFYLGTRSRFAPAQSSARRWGFAAGLAAGLGVFLTYSTLPVVAGVVFGGLLVSRVRPRAVWLAAVGGLALGLAPWLLTVLETGGGALLLDGRPLGVGPGLAEAWARVVLLVERGLFAGYDLPGGAGVRSAAAWVWLAVVVMAWLSLGRALVWRDRRVVALLVLLGTGAHLGAFCLSAPDASSRYLVAVYPLLFVAIASFAASNRWGGVSAGLVVALGLAAQVAVVAGGRYTALRVPIAGTDWELLGEVAGRKLLPEQIDALPDRVRPFVWEGFGWRVFGAIDRSDWTEVFGLLPAGARTPVWQGVGIAWVQIGSPGEAGVLLRQLPAPSRAALRRGLAAFAEVAFSPQLARDPGSLGPLLSRFAPEDRPALEDSLARVAAIFTLHEIPAPELPGGLLTQDASERGRGYAYYRGFGAGSPLTWAPVPNDELAFAEGLALGFERDLNARTADWILGAPAAGPQALARLLVENTGDLSENRAKVFYAAAGRAAHRAWREPGVIHPGRGRLASWRWQDAIPERYHAAFAAGLEAN